MIEQKGSGSMKKRKKLDQVTVSNEFLTSLLAPFIPIKRFNDLVTDEKTGKIVIYFEKEGGVLNTS